ncbi:MAG TPA: hypothetical protein PKV93_12295 [Fervidobacterium sp.]|nr:hypothetical protein [Fervidobacterium sp.]
MNKGTFNTIVQGSQKIGESKVIWSRVRELYQGGGTIDPDKFPPNTIIPAGTMVKFNGPGKEVDIVTADGNPGTKEINILVIAKGANTAGDITITLNNTPVTVTLTATENTPEDVAAKIVTAVTMATGTGYTATANGNMVVFTASEVGVKKPPVFEDTGNTGVVAEFETPVKGTEPQISDLTQVNGLIFEDVYMPEGTIHATCAVVRAGRIYADRVAGGGLPAAIEDQLPMIEFVRED